ncbi:MAG: hypothetical protein GY839_09675 [candidate division Zixibacteria bacterium]|nr:hypothetical protein [candidate division Zixibacteria bacterium]
MGKSYTNNINGGRRTKSLGNLGFDKFIKLAKNSYGVKKYSRAIDNCRLAVDFAVRQNDLEQAAEAYHLWIDSLFELTKYADVKKVCCDARSKFGHSLDLLYYEFKVAMLTGEFKIAAKLAKEFIESHKNIKAETSPAFNAMADKLDEITVALEDIEKREPEKQADLNLEQSNG